ncbi:MAG: TRAP transporter substrate-binding protein DctP [Myxococcota bacterium]
MKRVLMAAGIVLLLVLPATAEPEAVGAQQELVIRVATMAPRNSAWMRGFRQWDRSMRERSNGAVRLQIYAGGSAGDERSVVQKLQSRQLDAASMSITGLGMIDRSVYVLNAPGIIENYDELRAVRRAMDRELKAPFEDAGFKIIGWGDVGAMRLFSAQRIERPSDLRRARPWVWNDNPVFVEWLRTAEVRGVPLDLTEVLPGLQTRRIDTVPVSALGAVALQWFSHFRYVSEQANGVVIGGLVMRKDTFDNLPQDIREEFDAQAARASRQMARMVMRADDRAYQAVLDRGLTAVDVSDHEAEWRDVANRTRTRLTGRLYDADALQRVERIVSQHRARNPAP